MLSSLAVDAQTAEADLRPPLAVDLDGTLLCTDLLHETFASAFFRNPWLTFITVLHALPGGPARIKAALTGIGPVEVETLPLREPLLAYLEAQKALGRPLHLATAADRPVAEAVAARVGLFDRVYASDGARNLKGRAKAEALAAAFPDGFSYAGDSRADLPVWAGAESAVVVASQGLADAAGRVAEIERHIPAGRPGLSAWLAAARPHQWTKNLLILVPAALGWTQETPESLMRTAAAFVLFCMISSLTYIINDVADVQSDRRHATKRRRPFAAGLLRLGDGLLVSGLGIPALLLLALLLGSPGLAACLLAYTATTLAYSMGLKRLPLVDCLIIGALFTLRIAGGVTAGGLYWSPWLMTFSLALFFSLAMAKRHTELVAGGPDAKGVVRGRGFRYEDRSLVLAFGAAASTLSVLIVVLYLMAEDFPAGAYRHPLALWVAPPMLFLWIGRIWLLANRGEMHDDPVVFALRDRTSHLLGLLVAVAFLIALL